MRRIDAAVMDMIGDLKSDFSAQRLLGVKRRQRRPNAIKEMTIRSMSYARRPARKPCAGVAEYFGLGLMASTGPRTMIVVRNLSKD